MATYTQQLRDGVLKFGTAAGKMVFGKLDKQPKPPHKVKLSDLDFTADELRQIDNSLTQ